MRGSWLLRAFGLGATLLSASKAQALQCNPPPSYVLWTYPSASTDVVPTNAVFWVFGYANRLVTVELDGVEIPSLGEAQGLDAFAGTIVDDPRVTRFQRRYDFPLETAQFVPAEPLTPGEHEVAIHALDYGLEPGTYLTTETLRFNVRAEEGTPVAGDVAITAVTAYVWDNEYGPPAEGTFPPPGATSGACAPERVAVDAIYCDHGAAGFPRTALLESGPATRLELQSNETLSARLEVSATGAALGHLIDYLFVPGGCSSFVGSGTTVSGDAQGSVTSFYAQPVLSTGLGTPRAFTGELELVEGIGTPPVSDFPNDAGWCSLGAVRTRTRRSDLAALALFVASSALLRRSARRAPR